MSKFILEDIQKLFPCDDSEYNYIYFSYEPIDNAMGEHLVVMRDRDYQGSTRILLRDNNKFAIYKYEWGSCSGCDFAQSCKSHEQMLNYANRQYDSLEWTTREDLLEELNRRDNESKEFAPFYDENDVKFHQKCREFLNEEI